MQGTGPDCTKRSGAMQASNENARCHHTGEGNPRKKNGEEASSAYLDIYFYNTNEKPREGKRKCIYQPSENINPSVFPEALVGWKFPRVPLTEHSR